jgi:hypothetical protein
MDCEFLIESRIHERPGPLEESVLKNYQVSQEFIQTNQPLFTAVAMSLLNGVLETQNTVDSDIRECLDTALRNRRTRDSGLVYEAKPDNRIAAAVLEGFEKQLSEFRKKSEEWAGFPRIKDSDETKMIAFLRALEASHNNGRSKSRSFVHFLYGVAAQNLPPEQASTGPDAE